MTMTNRNVILPGVRTSNTLAGGVVTSTTVVVPKRSESLSNVTSATGDRKTPNNQTFDTDRYNYFEGSYFSGHVSGLSYTEQIGPLPWSPTGYGINPIPVNNVINQALSRLFDQLRGGVDMALNTAEFGETRALKHRAEEFETILKKNDTRRVFQELRRQFGSSTWRTPMRMGGNAWLTFQFGIKPLLGQIYSCIDAVRKAEPAILTLKSRARDNVTVPIDRPFSGDPDFQERGSVRWSTRVEYKCTFQVKPTLATALAGFTTLNPISIAWERLPWSFLVDYVYDVGGYMRNLETSYLFGTNFLRGYMTRGTLMEGDSGVYGEKVLGTTVKRISIRANSRHAEKRRTRLDSIPVPRPPQFDVQLGPTRLLNCAALLTNLLKGR